MAVITPRVREVENALASVRRQGLEPSDEAKAMFQRYVDGQLSSRKPGRAIDLRDIRDPEQLNTAEAIATTRRIRELDSGLMRQLALRNGYVLNWSRVSREQMIEASLRSFQTDNAGLEELLRDALDIEWNKATEASQRQP
jgi:fido (protein-threonine AMPylation protein)